MQKSVIDVIENFIGISTNISYARCIMLVCQQRRCYVASLRRTHVPHLFVEHSTRGNPIIPAAPLEAMEPCRMPFGFPLF